MQQKEEPSEKALNVTANTNDQPQAFEGHDDLDSSVHACEGKTISAKTLGDDDINKRISQYEVEEKKAQEMKKPVQWRTDECELRHRAEVIEELRDEIKSLEYYSIADENKIEELNEALERQWSSDIIINSWIQKFNKMKAVKDELEKEMKRKDEAKKEEMKAAQEKVFLDCARSEAKQLLKREKEFQLRYGQKVAKKVMEEMRKKQEAADDHPWEVLG